MWYELQPVLVAGSQTAWTVIDLATVICHPDLVRQIQIWATHFTTGNTGGMKAVTIGAISGVIHTLIPAQSGVDPSGLTQFIMPIVFGIDDIYYRVTSNKIQLSISIQGFYFS
jgi:hypothetical protein